MFTRWLRLLIALVVGMLAVLVLPVAGASAAEGGQLELSASSYQTETFAGAEYFFQSSVRNTGTATLHDVTLTHTLPPGVLLGHYEASYSNGDNGDRRDKVAGQVVTFSFATLEPGAEAERIAAQVSSAVPDVFPVGHVLTGRVTASSSDSVLPVVVTSPVCDDEPSSACVPVQVVAGPRVAFSVEPDVPTALPGDTVRFSVSMTNTGSVVSYLIVRGFLPDALEFVESEALMPDEFLFDTPGYGTALYKQVDLPPGETWEFSVVTILRSSPLGEIRTFGMDVYSSGIQTSSSPCAADLDLLDIRLVNGCAAILVGPASVAESPVVMPPAVVPPIVVPPAVVPPSAAVPAAVSAAVPPASLDGPADRVLARTGPDSTWALAVLVAGLLLSALGAVLLVGSRSRRSIARRPEPVRQELPHSDATAGP